MTDLELTRLCAEAMELKRLHENEAGIFSDWGWVSAKRYDPLHDDAQAMALVKKCRLTIEAIEVGAWRVENEEDMAKHGHDELRTGFGTDLNRAICECCAKMWLSHKGATDGNAEIESKDRREV